MDTPSRGPALFVLIMRSLSRFSPLAPLLVHTWQPTKACLVLQARLQHQGERRGPLLRTVHPAKPLARLVSPLQMDGHIVSDRRRRAAPLHQLQLPARPQVPVRGLDLRSSLSSQQGGSPSSLAEGLESGDLRRASTLLLAAIAGATVLHCPRATQVWSQQ